MCVCVCVKLEVDQYPFHWSTGPVMFWEVSGVLQVPATKVKMSLFLAYTPECIYICMYDECVFFIFFFKLLMLLLMCHCSCVCVCVVQVKQKINQAYESLHVVFNRSSTSEEAEQDGVDAQNLSSDRDSGELNYFPLRSSHHFPFWGYCVFCFLLSVLSLLWVEFGMGDQSFGTTST